MPKELVSQFKQSIKEHGKAMLAAARCLRGSKSHKHHFGAGKGRIEDHGTWFLWKMLMPHRKVGIEKIFTESELQLSRLLTDDILEIFTEYGIARRASLKGIKKQPSIIDAVLEKVEVLKTSRAISDHTYNSLKLQLAHLDEIFKWADKILIEYLDIATSIRQIVHTQVAYGSLEHLDGALSHLTPIIEGLEKKVDRYVPSFLKQQ